MRKLPERIGKYEVRGHLGVGATATVYQAYDPVIERTLAVKVVDKGRLDPQESKAILARFRIEARAAGRLQHPNIVAVYDSGEEDEIVYLVMECVFGRPLTAYLHGEDFSGEPEKVCDILLQVLSALAYSHSQGVIHRDIKPSNIMVSRDGVIKIADFGVARLESSNLTQTGDLIGTPSYMAPEQFAGEIADPRTDLYAVAVIFYELLTRKRPFDGPNSAVIMHRVFTETPVPPSVKNELLTTVLDPLVLRGLSKEPADRYQSAREFESAIREAMHYPLLKGAPPPIESPVPRVAPQMLKSLRTNLGKESGTLPGVPAPNVLAPLAPVNVIPAATAGDRANVLFVDDEMRILTALHALFRQQYRVYTADDPVQALEMVKRIPVQVVISDQRMPGMLGVELLRQIREVSPRSVRILLTGYSDLASIVGSINDGEVWRFINKPWNAQELQRVVAEAVDIAASLPDVPAWRLPSESRFDESILCLDPRDEIMPHAVRDFGERHWVGQARNLDEALRFLQEREVAVLVADLDADPAAVKALLHALKVAYPQILTIALTGAPDAVMLIDLINEVQVYRFIKRPLAPGQLHEHVAAALNRYHTYKTSPGLLKAQRVESEKVANSPVPRSLFQRLRDLRGRLPFSN
jgi:response regulator RpfG family c-di-GMP phosphodiesterase/tRNA A-37 threonylcarbamoyl transferase component Bud32